MGSLHLSRHEALVRRFGVKYRAERSGFFAALFRELSSQFDMVKDEFPKSLKWYRPDLFLIDAPARLVTIWEVEDCSPLKQSQIDQYDSLRWFIGDACEWKTDLRVIDRYGNENLMDVVHVVPGGPFEVVTKDFAEAAWEACKARASRKPQMSSREAAALVTF